MKNVPEIQNSIIPKKSISDFLKDASWLYYAEFNVRSSAFLVLKSTNYFAVQSVFAEHIDDDVELVLVLKVHLDSKHRLAYFHIA